MRLKQIITKKKEAEEEIHKILQEFYDDTGLMPSDIKLDYAKMTVIGDDDVHVIHSVALSVEL